MTKIEQVPRGSQVIVSPFLAAVAGYLHCQEGVKTYRLTMHRVISRAGKNQLQQLVNYVAWNDKFEKGEGRIFAVDEGIIGGAFREKKVMRTRKFKKISDLEDALNKENYTLDESKATKKIIKTAASYLAIPFTCDKSERDDKDDRRICLILYAESDFNIFANDEVVSTILKMCKTYCKQIDAIANVDSFGIQNFAPNLANSTDSAGGGRMFDFQEHLNKVTLPNFKSIEEGFNFEYTT